MSRTGIALPLDPEPWVTVEETVRQIGGGSFQRVTDDRAATPGPGRIFFPRYGYERWETEYPHYISDLVMTLAADRLARSNAQAEADLREVLGDRIGWPIDRIDALDFEMVWQAPDDNAAEYRGIRQAGRWVIDHHPNWPFAQ